jgi:serpin B
MKRILPITLACFSAVTALAGTNVLSEADNRFAFSLLAQIASAAPSQNIFISPYSVSTVLQILDNGAAGKTQTEIQRALCTENLPLDQVNEASRELNQSLQADSDVELDMANSIWFETGIQLKPAFVSTNKKNFQSKLASVDFKTPEAADTINQWAGKKTRGKINDIVAFPFPADTALILANAIYFKGKWANPFDPSLTQPRYFYPSGEIVKMTQMMSQEGNFNYEEGKDFQAVELPYTGGYLDMIVFLPATNCSPEKILARFNGQNWQETFLQQFSTCEGRLILPKFKISYDILLNDPLQALGMRQAFIFGSANFSSIAADPLFVSEVKQKSYIEVNEETTEAAAVTSVLISRAIANANSRPFDMRVDRPFLFMISDGSSGTILFAGIINDPTLH